jgi:hypothetical protein
VAHHAPSRANPQPGDGQPPVQSQPTSSSVIQQMQLPSPQFASGKSGDEIGLDNLKKELQAQDPRAGDMLLLVGSTDCAAIRGKQATAKAKSNEELAAERAEKVRTDLGLAESSGVIVKEPILPQYRECQPDDRMRAVFPFLIRSVSSSEQSAAHSK